MRDWNRSPERSEPETRRGYRLRVDLFALLVFGFTACAAAPVVEIPPPSPRERLGGAKRWAYWLQAVDLDQAAAVEAEVLVLDPVRDGGKPWTPAEIARLKRSGRLVLAYLSVGEAEDYRPYWKSSWKDTPPAWLGKENPEWKGNYPVRFWDPAWQELWLGPAGPLADALDAGFDGVYLDRVDVFWHWTEAKELAEEDAQARMAAFVRAIARAARRREREALVVLQNGSAVAVRDDVLGQIDGLALEDTFFDGDEPQTAEHTREVLEHAARVRKAGLPVLAVDYCRDEKNVERFYREARERGFVPYATVRDLDQLVPPR